MAQCPFLTLAGSIWSYINQGLRESPYRHHQQLWRLEGAQGENNFLSGGNSAVTTLRVIYEVNAARHWGSGSIFRECYLLNGCVMENVDIWALDSSLVVVVGRAASIFGGESSSALLDTDILSIIQILNKRNVGRRASLDKGSAGGRDKALETDLQRTVRVRGRIPSLILLVISGSFVRWVKAGSLWF